MKNAQSPATEAPTEGSSERNSAWLRTRFLGRQHHGAFRARGLLRAGRRAGDLPARIPAPFHGANRNADGIVWLRGLVSADPRRQPGRPLRLPQIAGVGLSDAGGRIFSDGLADRAWMAPLRERLPLFWVVFLVLMVPALGPSVVKPVVAGTTARASSESVRSIGYSIYYTLVNIGGMLGPVVAFLGSQIAGHRERISRIGRFCVRDVFCHAAFLQGAEPRRRAIRSHDRRRAAKHAGRSLKPALRRLPADLLGLLDHLLAGIHLLAAFPARLRRSKCQDRPFAVGRSGHGNRLPDRGQLPHAPNPGVHGHDPRHSHLQLFLAHSCCCTPARAS